MKKTVKRVFTWILAFTLICGMLPVNALAAIVDVKPEEIGAYTETAVCINPLYADVITEENLVQPSRKSTVALAGDSEPDYASTYEEAGAQMREGMKNRQETVVVRYRTENFDFSTEQKQIAAEALVHTGVPEEGDSLRWVYGGYSVSGSSYSSNGEYYVTLTYTVTYYTTAEQEAELDAAVEELLAQVDSSASDYQKLCAVYDYICTNITYDYDNLQDSTYWLKFTAYAALVNKTAVCQGYAALLYRLALELGIDCRMITGTGNGGGHAWNIVELNNVYYNVDATWDASWMQGVGYYNYFLQCEDTFTSSGTNHIRDDEYDTEDFHGAYPMSQTDYDPDAEPESPATAGTCGENLTWTLDGNGVLTISGQGKMTDFAFDYSDIPWYDSREQITKVIIEDGVTSISRLAFTECSNMTGVSIGSGVTEIGMYAFQLCTSLQSVTVPDQVTAMDVGVFTGCTALTTAKLGEGITEVSKYTFSHCTGLTDVTLGSGVTSILYDAFNTCTSLETIELPDTLTYLEGKAFCGCTALKEITLPESLEYIGASVFDGCKSLTTIVIPDQVTAIGDGAFCSCTSLTSVIIGTGVTSIEDTAFEGCAALESVYFKGNAPTFGETAFYETVTTAYYPAGNATWTSDVMQDYGGTITWVEVAGDPEYSVTYTSVSISLAGDIGLNYYAALSEDLAADEGAYLVFTYGDLTQTVPLSEAILGDDGNYRFSCAIPAKRMTDVVTGQMYTSDGTAVGEAKQYSVKRYCDAMVKYIEENSLTGYENLKSLMKAMLNYGAYSQISLGYNTDALANADLDEADKTLPGTLDASAYKHSVNGSEEGISVYSASLLLESKTTIRFYFQLTGDKTIGEYTFLVDGVETVPTQTGSLYYVDVPNVAAKDLDVMHTVSVGGLSVSYGGLSYVNQMMNWTSATEAGLNMAKALYLYNQAANTYFGE